MSSKDKRQDRPTTEDVPKTETDQRPFTDHTYTHDTIREDITDSVPIPPPPPKPDSSGD